MSIVCMLDVHVMFAGVETVVIVWDDTLFYGIIEKGVPWNLTEENKIRII